ncbi:FMRFamide receptor-like isoform X1 [Cydia pomonella]|uniref:FMRFamide receptor-like isoform X1 n=1 Tax=Cydia pomonella TaxID=82600 RepID=UPI002ADE377E|nr:FMRFamide receptor-like isoform X1 [Cydia pomonella]XP_061718283.1 FMRFamide receptor-like isoform X1 [Cydia pomonella]XP_061718290.1 FMRFamide receptor-like isoform X1 [Cydia pomonella]XP_061718296.1 FMRFamide receptor-like isoform X1 [Cydia pomonella]XP_061718304.1 FMRFamide receptor-like isoform X1 [Cydia pomonella]XP_061718321.1 FMRFamide receptor-like isoform X1 [Cydia pomonella]
MSGDGRNGTNGTLECDSDADVSESDKLFRFVVHGVLLNVVGCGGLLGNALCVAVLSRPQMRSSINCLLAGLAAADAALLVASVLLFGLSAVFPYTGRLRYYYYHICPRLAPLAYPLALVAQTMSVYLTLVVTAERWVAVCRPLRARALCTPRRARFAVVGVAIFAFAYNAPKFLEVEVVRIPALGEGADNEEDAIYCVAAAEFRSELYVAVYVHWLYLLVMYAVPFTALAVLNAAIVRQVNTSDTSHLQRPALRGRVYVHWLYLLVMYAVPFTALAVPNAAIVRQVRRAQAERARLSRSQRRELSLATMLLVVVLVFFLCNLLPLVTNSFEVFLGSELERLDALVKTSNLLVTINSSANFLIYVLFGDKFKRVFLATFCRPALAWLPCIRRREESPENTRDDSCASGPERLSLRVSLARDTTLRRSGPRRPRPRRPEPAPTVYYPATPSSSITTLPNDLPHNGHARDHF